MPIERRAGLAAIGLFALVASAVAREPEGVANPSIDMPRFLTVATVAAAHRESHRVSEQEFLLLAREPGTIVLDARSREKYDELHVKRVARDTRERLVTAFRTLPRPYALLAISVLLTGPLQNSVGIESFLQRVVARSGERLVYSPRLGLETEVIPSWLKVRAGTYGEPTRFAASNARLHGTLGFDAKVFPWSVFGLFDEKSEWRISGSADLAARYLGWGVSVGVWH